MARVADFIEGVLLSITVLALGGQNLPRQRGSKGEDRECREPVVSHRHGVYPRCLESPRAGG